VGGSTKEYQQRYCECEYGVPQVDPSTFSEAVFDGISGEAVYKVEIV
jgi:hypothetical protein